MAARNSPVNRFDGWQEYPWNHGIPIAPPHQENPLKAGLMQARSSVFSEEVDLWIIDFASNGSRCNSATHYTVAGDVENLLLQDERNKPRIRVISLHSKNSRKALRITESLMRKIMTFYKVDSNFLHVLLSFGQVPHLSETGASNISHRVNADKSRDLSYQLRYCEENFRVSDQPYSIRQTGIYHHHEADDNFDLFVLLNPSMESQLEVQLLELCSLQKSADDLCSHPYRIHLIPFTLYIDNWRWYFRRLGDNFERKNDKIMTAGLDYRDTSSLHFDRVQELRDLRGETFLMGAHCRSALVVLEDIKLIPANGLADEWTASPLIQRLRGYNESIGVLSSRVSNAIDLQAYALELKNQLMAAKTNAHVSSLAEKATHDTTSVKWITYLTLIYLPGTFVATLYGMNFFLFDPQRKLLVVATDFWLFIATWLPLTFFTFLGYVVMRGFHKARNPEDAGREKSDFGQWKDH